jgi:hypothetical protein
MRVYGHNDLDKDELTGDKSTLILWDEVGWFFGLISWLGWLVDKVGGTICFGILKTGQILYQLQKAENIYQGLMY